MTDWVIPLTPIFRPRYSLMLKHCNCQVRNVNLFIHVFLLCFLKDAINAFDDGDRAVTGDTATAGIWASYPQPFVTVQEGFLDQV